MNPIAKSKRVALALACVGLISLLATPGSAQTTPAQRTFSQSKAAIEKALQKLQPELSGRLPVLDGFAQAGAYPLDRYQRGYFQSTVDIKSTPGGSIVTVTTKITAWYADPAQKKSGYQLLTSNGRVEGDLLDQLEDQLAANAPTTPETTVASAPAKTAPATNPALPPSTKPTVQPESASDSAIAAPAPNADKTLAAAMNRSLADTERQLSPATDRPDRELQSEAQNLEEILKNTAHPKNLVAVKKSGTPVVATPSISAKPEFLASLHDEFELLDFNADWVHVRISGLSRGWIWRDSVEMPDGIADTDVPGKSGLPAAADLFHVTREETAPFPGDWEPLRSKNVKIISVQKIDEAGGNVGAKEKLEFTKFLLEKSAKEMAQKSPALEGVVVIFDSADGGMIAATAGTLQQWIAGNLTDSAMWHKCFFDPPETFDSSAPSASK